MRSKTLVATLVGAVLGAGLAVAPAQAQFSPDASFTIDVRKDVVGSTVPGLFQFELVCSSDDGVGESSAVSINDPTFSGGFAPSDEAAFGLADGQETSFTVYVEFSRDTVITCVVSEVGAPVEPDATTVRCDDTDLIECTSPTDGATATQATGSATLSWVDIPDFPAGDTGNATFAFTNTYEPPTTTSTSTTAAPQAAVATPRFTG